MVFCICDCLAWLATAADVREHCWVRRWTERLCNC